MTSLTCFKSMIIRSQTEQNVTALAELHLYLQQKFPWVFKNSQVAPAGCFLIPSSPQFVTRSYPNTHSILLRVQGAQESSSPYMLCAHLDVVPAGDRERCLQL